MEWLTRKQAADKLQVTTRTIDRYIDQGKIKAVPLGPRMIRISTESLEKLLTPPTSA